MNPLRVMVVDDERLARLHLTRLLGDHPGILVVGEAENLTQATAVLAREVVDVIFLDISMPPENGFDLLPQVPAHTRVVFVTAHADHAVRAFAEEALDYLLKPVRRVRLHATLRRLTDMIPLLERFVPPVPAETEDWRGASQESISSVSADGNYCWVHLMAGRRFLLRRPMQDWIKLPGSQRMVALSRSLLVNPAAVLELELTGYHAARLRLMGMEDPVELGRAATRRARDLLGL